MSYAICYGAKRARKTGHHSKRLEAKFRYFEIRRLLAENIHTEKEEDKSLDAYYTELALASADFE